MVKRFALDKCEFGETYHVGAALLFDEDVEAYLIYEEDTKEIEGRKFFLEYVAQKKSCRKRVCIMQQVEYNKKKREDGNKKNRNRKDRFFGDLPDTADIIKLGFDSEKIRKAFLGSLRDLDKDKVKSYLETKGLYNCCPKMLIWIRQRQCHGQERNITLKAVKQIKKVAADLDMFPVYVGHNLGGLEAGSTDLIEFYNDCIFKDKNGVSRQLCMFDLLREKSKSLVSVGMKSGGMDGPAFLGVPTVQFEKVPKKEKDRMGKLIGIVQLYKRVCLQKGKFAELSCSELSTLEREVKDILSVKPR